MCNLHKIARFCSKLVPSLSSFTFPGLDKHTSLPQNTDSVQQESMMFYCTGACAIKTQGVVMNRFRSKLVCWSKPVKVTYSKKDTSLIRNLFIFCKLRIHAVYSTSFRYRITVKFYLHFQLSYLTCCSGSCHSAECRSSRCRGAKV